MRRVWSISIITRKHGAVEEWIESRTSSSDLIKDGEVYLATTAIELKGLYENDCNRVYCYQSRLDFSQIPSSMWKGLIGIEDYRFFPSGR